MEKAKRLLLAGSLLGVVVPRASGEKAGSILWSVSFGAISAFDSSAAIAPDGTIYITSFNTRLDALAPDGRVKWSFPTTADIKSSPAIGDDGTIYFGGRDLRFYAVTSQGKLKWSFPVVAWVDSSPAIAEDGTIYFGCWDGKFYALDPAGRKKWEVATGGPVDSSPAIGADGTVYVGSHDKKFYALNPNGSRKWTFETGGAIISSPAIGPEGTLYFTSVDGNLYAITSAGAKKWQLHTGGVHASSPVIDEAGMIYVGVNNCMWAVNPDGTKSKWDFCVDDERHTLYIECSPAVTSDGMVVFGSDYGALYGFNPTNSDRDWSAYFGGAITASAAIVPNGTIYVGASGTPKAFNAVRGTAGPARSSWPKFRGDLRQTGRVAKQGSRSETSN